MTLVFPFEPDWAEPYTVDFAFQTEIVESRNHNESREVARVVPRKSFRYRVAENNGRFRRLRSTMRAFQQAEFFVADATRGMRLETPVAAISTLLVVDAIPSWAVIGRMVMIGEDVAQIESIAGLEVTLATPTASAHDAGAWVRPALRSRMAQNLSFTLPVNLAAFGEMQFEVDPGEDHLVAPVTSPVQSFNGHELWLKRPNWIDGLSVISEGNLESVDYGIGAADYTIYDPWNAASASATYLGRTNAEAEEMVEFFHRVEGRAGAFYMPTWEPDFPVLGSGASMVMTPGTDAFQFDGDEAYHAIVACYANGNFAAKLVDRIETDGTNSSIYTTTPWATPPTPANALHVSWLPLWRFASDTLTMEWITGSVAQWKLGMRQLRRAE